MLGGGWALYAMLVGGVDTGWTFYTPYSSQSSHYNVALTMVGVVLGGFSSLLTGLNFIVTIHWLRAPGMGWFRMPIFAWTMYATSFIFLLAVPVLAMALTMVIVERVFQFGIFDPALGGDPRLFQHLFWFYSHPAVYIMILPGMGVVSEVIPCFARKNLYGLQVRGLFQFRHRLPGLLRVGAPHVRGRVVAVRGADLLEPELPGGHTIGDQGLQLDRYALQGFDLLRGAHALRVGVRFAVHLWRPLGLFLATLGVDLHVHDTYFVIAHFHFIMVGGMVLGYMAGLHYWWPKITGRLYNDWWSRLAALIIFIGFFLTFLPQFVAGINGMPRRYHMYAPEFQVWNVLSTAGASILGVGYVLPFFYLIPSLLWGKPAGPNPWHATGLEWQTPSPPPKENFEKTPIVVHPPYQYHLEKAQNEP